MLVLSRNTNQSTLIGEDVKVTVLEIKGNQVKIGIKAPEDVVILREELVEGSRFAQIDIETVSS